MPLCCFFVSFLFFSFFFKENEEDKKKKVNVITNRRFLSSWVYNINADDIANTGEQMNGKMKKKKKKKEEDKETKMDFEKVMKIKRNDINNGHIM